MIVTAQGRELVLFWMDSNGLTGNVDVIFDGVIKRDDRNSEEEN